MAEKLRKSGIDIIGDIPWGTHFCQFYQTKEDLMDMLIPYLKTGLENNELCMWVTSQPLEMEEAKEALRRAISDFDIYLEKGQIEIIPYTHYIKEGVFDPEKVLNEWVKKLNKALASGYDGLRLAGNTFWLEKEDWDNLIDYEKKVDAVISNYHMIATCTYSLNMHDIPETIDIPANHQFTLVKKEGKWERIENSGRKNINDQKQAEEELCQSEQNFRLKSENSFSPARRVDKLELADIIDIQAVQSLMDDFYKFAHITIALLDLKGNVLVGVGWQDICTKFHRVHPEACKHCVESDTELSTGVPPGEFKLYKCKNNMWDIVTPIIVDGQHIGNIFSGQFFFEDESLDYEPFRVQARKYGFDEEEYIAALERVPRLSRETVEKSMSFFMKLANMLSQLSHSNIKLAQSLEERDTLVEALQESEKRERARSNELETVLDAVPVAVYIAQDPQALKITGNRLSYEWLRVPAGTNFSKSAPEGERPEMFNLFKDGREIPPEKMPSQMSAAGIDINDCELDIVSADGEIRHVLGNARSLRDERGNLRGSISAFIDITERKKAEEALRKSLEMQKTLKTIISKSPAVAFLWKNTEGWPAEFVSENVTQLGYTVEDFISGNILYGDIIHKEDIEAVKENLARSIREGPNSFEMEYRIFTGENEIRWVEERTSIQRGSKGEVTHFQGIIVDVTERKEAEEALKKAYDNLEEIVKERTADLEKAYNSLKESEKGLAEAQKMAHIGNWDWDLATDKVSWSDELYRIFGCSPQKTGATYDELLSYVHPDDRDYVDNAIKKALNEKSLGIDYRVILANEEERIVHAQSEVIFDKKNIPIRAKGIVQDVTELKRAEESLRESEARLRRFYESDMIGVFYYNLDGSITDSNDKLLEIVGYTREDLQAGRVKWDKMTPPEYRHLDEHATAELKATGVNAHYEKEYIRKDGSRVPIIIGSATFDQARNEGIAFVLDITERKKAEEALANIEIARKKEIHHRIKNNLQVISSLLDLQTDKFDNPKVIEAFRESQNRVISMALIHEELYKGEGTDTLDFSEYLQELAENLFQTYSLSSKNIHLKMDLEGNAFFDMDIAVPLGIIVNELVSNSLKHAFPGRDRGEIRIKLRREENEECIKSINKDCKSINFTLIVSDDGVGISEKLDIEGLDSLGFQLVTSLVDQLNGEFELKRSNGTEFTLRFTVMEKDNVSQAGLKSQESV